MELASRHGLKAVPYVLTKEGTAESAEIAEKTFLCDLCVLRGFF